MYFSKFGTHPELISSRLGILLSEGIPFAGGQGLAGSAKARIENDAMDKKQIARAQKVLDDAAAAGQEMSVTSMPFVTQMLG